SAAGRVLHQLDAMAARTDRFGALRSPPFALRPHLEAALLEPFERPVEVGDDDRRVAALGDRRLLGPQQVDLGPVAFVPAVVVGEVGRWVALSEAEHRPELRRAPAVGRVDLQRHVVKHHKSSRFARGANSQICTLARSALMIRAYARLWPQKSSESSAAVT